MADNEKLDNQRLKNFKNKGRDLEVKVVLNRRWRVFSLPRHWRSVSPLALPPGFLVTSFLISTIGNFVTKASAKAFAYRLLKVTGILWAVYNLLLGFVITPRDCVGYETCPRS